MGTVRKKSVNPELSLMSAETPITLSTNFGVFNVEPELFRDMVSARAFYKAEQRGFEPGHELEDWLEAEQEFLNNPSLLTGGLD